MIFRALISDVPDRSSREPCRSFSSSSARVLALRFQIIQTLLIVRSCDELASIRGEETFFHFGYLAPYPAEPNPQLKPNERTTARFSSRITQFFSRAMRSLN